jgi:ArsR family transcriptional regulator, arsenate/arsenite/antimonite-responsive transcriptional repressor
VTIPAAPPLDRLFRALTDPTRLRLLHLMTGREICVCHFVESLGISQPKVSRHLAYLRRAGIVAACRSGKWMYYRLAPLRDRAAAAILRETLRSLRRSTEMRRDAACLAACCAPRKFRRVRRASRPGPPPVRR